MDGNAIIKVNNGSVKEINFALFLLLCDVSGFVGTCNGEVFT